MTKLQSFSFVFLSSNLLRGFQGDNESPPCAHQYELIAVQLSGPVGFGAVTVHQSLLTVHLILRHPGGEALQREGQQSGKVSIMVSVKIKHIGEVYPSKGRLMPASLIGGFRNALCRTQQ